MIAESMLLTSGGRTRQTEWKGAAVNENRRRTLHFSSDFFPSVSFSLDKLCKSKET